MNPVTRKLSSLITMWTPHKYVTFFKDRDGNWIPYPHSRAWPSYGHANRWVFTNLLQDSSDACILTFIGKKLKGVKVFSLNVRDSSLSDPRPTLDLVWEE